MKIIQTIKFIIIFSFCLSCVKQGQKNKKIPQAKKELNSCLADHNTQCSLNALDYLIQNDRSERHTWYYKKAEIYQKKMKLCNKAVESYQKSLSYCSGKTCEPQTYYELGRCYFFIGEYDQAVVELDQLMGLSWASPNLVSKAKWLKGQVYFSTGKSDVALKNWLQLYEKSPEFSKKYNILQDMILAYQDLEDFQPAISLLETAQKEMSEAESKAADAKLVLLKRRLSQQPGGLTGRLKR